MVNIVKVIQYVMHDNVLYFMAVMKSLNLAEPSMPFNISALAVFTFEKLSIRGQRMRSNSSNKAFELQFRYEAKRPSYRQRYLLHGHLLFSAYLNIYFPFSVFLHTTQVIQPVQNR